jgi:hypothetical protein
MACLRKVRSFAPVSLMFFLLWVTSCKSSSPPKKDSPNPSPFNQGTLGDTVQCASAADCKPGSPSLMVNGMVTPRLVGDVNQQISWQISAKSSLYPGRSYAALRLQFNPVIQKLTVRQPTSTLTGSDNISVDGKLAATDAQLTSTATIIVRDMTACKVTSGNDSQSCFNPAQTSQFDSTLTASVSFTNSNYNPYSPNAVIPDSGNNNSSGNDVGSRIGIMAGLGGLQALFNGDGTLLGVLGGMVNGAISGLNTGMNSYSGGTSNLFSGNGFYNQSGYSQNNTQGYQQNNYIQGY